MQPGEQDAIIGLPEYRTEAAESSPGPAELSEDELV
jgi:hypothetical protein